jgi:hypothetical protein
MEHTNFTERHKVNTVISIANDFSKFPAGRYESDGPASGQSFREKHLKPALDANDMVTVDMDGVLGYGSSFLEEAFGGLVRDHKISLKQLKEKLKVQCSVSIYEDRVWKYIEDEDARSA